MQSSTGASRHREARSCTTPWSCRARRSGCRCSRAVLFLPSRTRARDRPASSAARAAGHRDVVALRRIGLDADEARDAPADVGVGGTPGGFQREEQVDVGLAGKLRVHRDAEQAAVVASRAPGRRCRRTASAAALPFCQTRTTPLFSAMKIRPSGAKAMPVAKGRLLATRSVVKPVGWKLTTARAGPPASSATTTNALPSSRAIRLTLGLRPSGVGGREPAKVTPG